MSEPNRCPECGAELPSGTMAGLCPKCLLAAGLESRDDAQLDDSVGRWSAPTSPQVGNFVPPDPAWLAAHFPHLEIIELLGHGGMGAVYMARQPKLDRLVALKIIRPESANTPTFAERFNREARMLARLSHPHIVAVYDFGEVSVSDPAAGGQARPLYYFLMEYVDGANLRQLMQAGELTPQQALAIVPQICEALQFAHDEGVVHRDIKPENILLDKRGRVKIADFGLARLAVGSTEEFALTGTHQVMGTPRYMAPEQMEGFHAVDHRADIYSLGVVFYEMLTGEVPAGHFEPPSKKVEIDVRLDEVVLRSLAREPERRYQHASDVKTDVESISQTPVTCANAPSGVVEAAPRFSRKAVLGASAVALAVAASIIVLVTGAIVLLHIRRLRADALGGPPVPWWEYAIMVTLGIAFLGGLIAPFAATILGIVAMREIKDSKGRLVGFGLAFFDAVFFPVLLIDAVILAVFFLPAAYIGVAAGMDEEAASILLPLLLVAVPADILLIRWWWRAAVRDRQLVGSGTERGTGSLTHHESNRWESSGGSEPVPLSPPLAREPERRNQHMGELKTDMESLSSVGSFAPERATPSAQTKRFPWTAFWIGLGALASALSLIAFAMYWTSSPWPLLGITLLWFVAGLIFGVAGGGDKEAEIIVPAVLVHAAATFLASLALLAYAIVLIDSAQPLWMVILCAAAIIAGGTIGYAAETYIESEPTPEAGAEAQVGSAEDEVATSKSDSDGPGGPMILVGTIATITLASSGGDDLLAWLRDESPSLDWKWQFLLGGPLVVLGGMAMQQQRAYWLAIVASVACLPLGLGSENVAVRLIPFALGLYSLYRLSQTEVREAFGRIVRAPMNETRNVAGDPPQPSTPRGTLGRAWDVWWAERDRWVTNTVQSVLCIGFSVCLILYISFSTSSGQFPEPDGQWLRHTIVTIGAPDPWFKWETYPDKHTPFRSKIDLVTTSTGIMLLGFLAWCANWQIEKAKAKATGKKLRWWHGSPNFGIAILGVFTLAAIVMVFVCAESPQRLDRRGRPIETPIAPAEDKESPGPEQQVERNDGEATAMPVADPQTTL